MFVMVQFGDNRMELFNLNCRLINFIQNLKERCNVESQDCVELMDRSGELMSLNEREQSVERASSFLKERQSYILLQVSRDDGTDGNKYLPLLNNLGRCHPELAEILRKMSLPSRERDRKGGPYRKGWPQRDALINQTRNKTTSGNKKSNSIK
ncbi:uncharacterized protein C22orf15 [Osmerus mordax]|uniref:uncharacterized protein C22orf15 n=1 Tax=Osmerus mordax TaxID=8014 RepID=UPI00350E9AEE